MDQEQLDLVSRLLEYGDNYRNKLRDMIALCKAGQGPQGHDAWVEMYNVGQLYHHSANRVLEELDRGERADRQATASGNGA